MPDGSGFQPVPRCVSCAQRHGLKTRATKMQTQILPIIREQPYPLLFVTISGAHLYGFPSPDSDYDLRGMHVLPIREVIGLNAARETIELSSTRDEIGRASCRAR